MVLPTSAAWRRYLAGLPVTTGGNTDPAPLLVGSQLDRCRRQPHPPRWRRLRRRWRRRVDLDWSGESVAGHMDPKLTETYPAIYMAMVETADVVAERYNVARDYQDKYSLRVAAAHRQRSGGRPLRGRDRADATADDARRQGDRTSRSSTTSSPRRVQPPRHHARRPAEAAARPRRGHTSPPATPQLSRRRGRRGDDVRRGSLARGIEPLGASGARPSPAASPTRWASARCSPCRSCSSATA